MYFLISYDSNHLSTPRQIYIWSHTFMTSSRWGRSEGGGGGQVKNGQNSDEIGWLQGEGIRRNWMSRAIISISVIRVQTVFQTNVLFCYKSSRQLSGSALVLFLAFQVRRVCSSFTAEYWVSFKLIFSWRVLSCTGMVLLF